MAGDVKQQVDIHTRVPKCFAAHEPVEKDVYDLCHLNRLFLWRTIMIKLDEIDFMVTIENVNGFIGAGMDMVVDELGRSTHPDAKVTRFQLAVEIARMLQAEEHFWLSCGREVE